MEQAARSTKWGIFGPIDAPMMIIPGVTEYSTPAPTKTPPRASAMARPWVPSFQVIGGRAASYGTTIVGRDGPLVFEMHAFASAILDGEIYVTVDHRKDLRLASRLDGSLKCVSTTAGLLFELNPFASEDARRMDLFSRARRREFIGASIGGWTYSGKRRSDGMRVATRVHELTEISLVTATHRPKDPYTWVSVGTSGRLERPSQPTARRD
jgi:hypothetical protein